MQEKDSKGKEDHKEFDIEKIAARFSDINVPKDMNRALRDSLKKDVIKLENKQRIVFKYLEIWHNKYPQKEPNLKKADLTKARLQGADLEKAFLTRAHLEWANLTKARLQGAHLRGAHLEKAFLTEADLTEAHLEWANLIKARLQGAHLRGAHLEWAFLTEADLTEAHLEWAHLTKARLQGAHLRGAHLEKAFLTEADLTEAHLEWANLIKARLQGAHLRGAHLEWAFLTEADLTEAHLEWAHLTKARLQGAHLRGAHLEKANLTGADLTEAHLENAFLTGAHLENADLKGADLKGAYMGQSIIIGAKNLNISDAQRASAISTPEQLNKALEDILKFDDDQITKEHLQRLPNLYRACVDLGKGDNPELKATAQKVKSRFPYLCEPQRVKKALQKILNEKDGFQKINEMLEFFLSPNLTLPKNVVSFGLPKDIVTHSISSFLIDGRFDYVTPSMLSRTRKFISQNIRNKDEDNLPDIDKFIKNLGFVSESERKIIDRVKKPILEERKREEENSNNDRKKNPSSELNEANSKANFRRGKKRRREFKQ